MANWLVINYRPTTLFSLRMSHATSSGGKTLLVPTPYAFKLAMVDAAFRYSDLKHAKQVFNILCQRSIRFQPPKRSVVTNTFIKILRRRELKSKSKDPVVAAKQIEELTNSPYIQTIAYREFCFFEGILKVAIHVEGLTRSEVQLLRKAAAHINYLGKRGSFMQYYGDEVVEHLVGPFTVRMGEPVDNIGQYYLGQFLDDLGNTASKDLFERVNPYSEKRAELHKHRIFEHHLIPYKQVRSSHRYTEYLRTDCAT